MILFCSVLAAFACTQQVPEVLEPESNTGKLSVTLQTDSRIQVTKAAATAEFVPEIDQLKVEVFKNPGPSQIRLYRDTYKNTLLLEGGIPLNCADYRILASFGDSLGVGFTPDKVYYSGSYDFVLEPNEVEEAEITVKPDNVRAITLSLIIATISMRRCAL